MKRCAECGTYAGSVESFQFCITIAADSNPFGLPVLVNDGAHQWKPACEGCGDTCEGRFCVKCERDTAEVIGEITEDDIEAWGHGFDETVGNEHAA